METMKVMQLMRAIEQFPRISSGATFMDAVAALEKADEKFKAGEAPERILLVYDEDGKIRGKLSPIDVVKALEPEYIDLNPVKKSPHFRLLEMSLTSMNEQLRQWHKPLADLRQKADTIKIKDFIKKPSANQMVNANENVDAAFYLFMVGRHGSLFVQDGGKIVGLMLFSDLYRRIKEALKTNPAPPAA